MSEISILAIDLAKGRFQVCGGAADGAVIFNSSVTRPRLYQFLADQACRVVAYLKATLEAIAAGHPVNRIDELLPWKFRPSS